MPDFLTSLAGTDGILLGVILPFLFVLIIVVFVHEMGHYLVGRWCGIAAQSFSIGFGPEIVGFDDRHGTRWKLSLIPLGGYVKFLGDMTVTSSTSDAEQLATLSAFDRSRAFHVQPVWKRFLTVLAGPVFNFILTIIVFAVMFATNGRYEMDPLVGEVMPGGAAMEAGFQPGDKFVSMNGVPISEFADVQRFVATQGGDPIRFVVQRNGQDVPLTVTPQRVETTDPLGSKVTRYQIGIRADISQDSARRIELGPVESLGLAVSETGYMIAATGQFMKRLVMGREDRCQLGGPVKIADMAGKAAAKGFVWVVQLVAMLSVGIGILNLLPIPPLDGGHLMFYAIEAVKGRPVSEAALESVYKAGFLVVLLFMGFVFWNDLVACRM
ncbi:MAG: RIP metalloprotease RseP [Zhengella sp.]|uniref:RIP metalloprotease RseP n=1 Tax=Zhengella sp. TaxID=2282762 RepID=UPI001D2DF217|nr:RIP metalloprotease RseP [Notoacmeibacter sp.]MCC0027048.1 RIP metalloprotease RseP [Brucellaceae bacterium]